jgi:hypothetical protein
VIVSKSDLHLLLCEPKPKQALLDFKIYLKTGLTIIGALGMMSAAYFDGTANDYGRYGTLFWIGFLVFLVGLAFAISSQYYWVRAVKYDMNEY